MRSRTSRRSAIFCFISRVDFQASLMASFVPDDASDELPHVSWCERQESNDDDKLSGLCRITHIIRNTSRFLRPKGSDERFIIRVSGSDRYLLVAGSNLRDLPCGIEATACCKKCIRLGVRTTPPVCRHCTLRLEVQGTDSTLKCFFCFQIDKKTSLQEDRVWVA
jgi:hypothetical protein